MNHVRKAAAAMTMAATLPFTVAACGEDEPVDDVVNEEQIPGEDEVEEEMNEENENQG